ncbi:MAG: TIGR01459 family HAD-type hydrolase [Salinarimonas sp.]
MRPATLAGLAPRFDAFLVDQFGVLLAGNGAYPWAPRALSLLARTGKPVILLSNSGKRSAPNAARLERLGFARDSFRLVLSSGEAAYRMLRARALPAGTPVWLHARDGDESAIAGLGFEPVADPVAARLLVLAGSRADELDLDAYRALLAPAAARSVPMICTNPDVEMLTPSGIRPGAGRIAALYEELGGAVEWIGKPHPLVYAEAARLLPGVAAERVLCIGDSPAHDIAGGRAAGHATALVRSGLHAEADDAELAALCRAAGVEPDYVLSRFDWPEA